MDKQHVEKIITGYLKPVYGFALRRCKSMFDAEDLSQEIMLRAYRALLIRDDIEDAGKFIWTVAHNALSNYYRDAAKRMVGVTMDEIAELADPCAEIGADDRNETIRRLQNEIAYLSYLQREIVIAYYFENRKQADIATGLGIPLGTVKWHLFEAKKELKRGMNTMREAGELKFRPMKFHTHSVDGSIGDRSPADFFRTALPQNICYCVRNTAKTVGQIADELGVSPVYVEAEAELLEENGFLLAQKDGYIANFIISEPTGELLALQNDMYKGAASLFANDLYDELTGSGILDDPGILCGYGADHNFLLWSLIPYIAAWSGEEYREKSISFEEAATMRPDGGYNIYRTAVMADSVSLPEEMDGLRNWCGPMWNGDGKNILWQIDSRWTDRGERHGMQHWDDAMRTLSLYAREREESLSKDEYAWLAERGYIKTGGEGKSGPSWQILILADTGVKDRLLAIGDRIKARHKDAFAALKAPYAQAVLASVPAHLRKVEAYQLQSVFHSDGAFLYHCVMALLDNGKLRPPTENQRKALSIMIFPQ